MFFGRGEGSPHCSWCQSQCCSHRAACFTPPPHRLGWGKKSLTESSRSSSAKSTPPPRSATHVPTACMRSCRWQSGTSAQSRSFSNGRSDAEGQRWASVFGKLHGPAVLGRSQNINPGLQVSVKLAFDVPPGVRPTQIVLHESASSHGAPVKLLQPPSPSPSQLPRAANGGSPPLAGVVLHPGNVCARLALRAA